VTDSEYYKYAMGAKELRGTGILMFRFVMVYVSIVYPTEQNKLLIVDFSISSCYNLLDFQNLLLLRTRRGISFLNTLH
jgi:hypothetical protein